MYVPSGISLIRYHFIFVLCHTVLNSTLFLIHFTYFISLIYSLLKKDVFPKEVFMGAGEKLLQPQYEPKFKAIFREPDLEAGQAIARYTLTYF